MSFLAKSFLKFKMLKVTSYHIHIKVSTNFKELSLFSLVLLQVNLAPASQPDVMSFVLIHKGTTSVWLCLLLQAMSGETNLNSGMANPDGDEHEEDMLRQLFKKCDDEIRTGQVRSVDLINSIQVERVHFHFVSKSLLDNFFCSITKLT